MQKITRRRFSAGLIVAGAMAATKKIGYAKSGANEKINVAILGCRNRGHQVARGFINTGACRIVTLCDPDLAMIDSAAKIMSKNCPAKPKIEQDFRRVLDDKDVDAIVVATPDHWHALMTLHGLAAGKHVYLEKPASYCIAEGKAMVQAHQKYPKLALCVGTQHRSGPHFLQAKQFIAEGNLGKIAFARAWMSHQRPFIPVIPDSEPPASMDYDLWLGPAAKRPYNKNCVHYNWHFIRSTGTNDTGNWGAHWLDTVRMLLDLDWPTKVSGTGGIFVVHDAKEWHDTQTVIYHYPEMTLLWELRLWSKYGVQGLGGGVEISGEKGAIIANRSSWTFHPKGEKPVEHKANGMVEQHYRNFIDCVQGNAKPAAPIVEGHKSASLCHLANIACDLNRSVTFDPDTYTFKGDPEATRRVSRTYREPWTLPDLSA